MHAAVLNAFGTLPRSAEFSDPVAGEGESLIEVRAAALHRVDRVRATGDHYTSGNPGDLPLVCGLDGVGISPDGGRYYFALPRAPYGSMAERTVVPNWMLAPMPSQLSDAEAAALINPGMAAYLPLAWRGRLAAGETVLVIGATGVTGRLAVQMARLLGAGRVVAAGRNPQALESLTELGADSLISLDRPKDELVSAFAAEAGKDGFQVVVDYLWGPPMEALLAAITLHEFKAVEHETRIVQVGDIAGPTLELPADALRSVPVTLTGSGGFVPMEVRTEAFGKLCEFAASGAIKIAVEEVPLAEVEEAWRRGDRDGRRQVLIP
ncbi:zinc-binding alcohol dehydrogenase family protein [Streptosporangium sp. 'caverna']|uniref:quinone oxidoreductase family protein n=1 Tax=Streptosporangium sp. 'caverna' TaxID=2202249 RepID=UPI000D7D7021|nr:zinc-binding alcohol dehydrogenase family protein [Streptosporangium sp. 'caverna']AWS44271.1 zinc-binding alcohol dehydrogenase [Streptosporangium sp. 'caverna']